MQEPSSQRSETRHPVRSHWFQTFWHRRGIHGLGGFQRLNWECGWVDLKDVQTAADNGASVYTPCHTLHHDHAPPAGVMVLQRYKTRPDLVCLGSRTAAGTAPALARQVSSSMTKVHRADFGAHRKCLSHTLMSQNAARVASSSLRAKPSRGMSIQGQSQRTKSRKFHISPDVWSIYGDLRRCTIVHTALASCLQR